MARQVFRLASFKFPLATKVVTQEGLDSMKFEELKNKEAKELTMVLQEQHALLLKLHLQQNVRELKNVRSIRATKKNIARLATLVHTKSLI